MQVENDELGSQLEQLAKAKVSFSCHFHVYVANQKGIQRFQTSIKAKNNSLEIARKDKKRKTLISEPISSTTQLINP